MRIDKLLANSGYGSRTEVKKLLKKGVVKLNDVVIKDGSSKIDPENDVITVQGEKLNYKEFIYLLMNKPKGVISATEDLVEKCVVDLLSEQHRLFKPFPVGRLDKDTEGLLVLTNDGKLSHELLAPKKKVKKKYFAIVDGIVTEEDVHLFKQGVELDDGYVTKPAQLKILKGDLQSEIELTITEGKFHQVKRMFLAVDKRVTYLKRIQMGGLKLDPSIGLGEYRELSESEVELLKSND